MSIQLPPPTATFPVVGDRAPPPAPQASTASRLSSPSVANSNVRESLRATLQHTASPVLAGSDC